VRNVPAENPREIGGRSYARFYESNSNNQRIRCWNFLDVCGGVYRDGRTGKMKSYWQERDYLETSSFISPRECPYCGFHVCFDASYIEQFKPNEEIPLLCPNTGCASNRDDGVMRLINIPEETNGGKS